MDNEDHIKNVKRLLNSLGITDSEKIKAFALSASPTNLNIFLELHPIYGDLPMPAYKVAEKYNLSTTGIWNISNRILKKIKEIAGVTINSSRLTHNGNERKHGEVFSYNINIQKLLEAYGIKDTNIIYAISNRISSKNIDIYMSFQSFKKNSEFDIESIIKRFNTSLIEIKSILEEVQSVFMEIAHVKIEIPDFDFVGEIKKQEQVSALTSILNKYEKNNSLFIKELLLKLKEIDYEILRLMYEKNMFVAEITKKLGLNYQKVIYHLEKIQKAFKDICDIELPTVKKFGVIKTDNEEAALKEMLKKVLLYYNFDIDYRFDEAIVRLNILDLSRFLENLESPVIADEEYKRIRTSLSKVRVVLREVYGIEFQRKSVTKKHVENKASLLKPRVKVLLSHYDVYDEEKIDAVCMKIEERDLNRYLIELGDVSLFSEEELSKKPRCKSTIINSISSVKSILRNICGIEFERSTKVIEVSDDTLRIFTEFFYNNGITDSSIIRRLILSIGEEKIKTFMFAVIDGSHLRRADEIGCKRGSMDYFIKTVQSKIFDVTGIKILTKHERELQEKPKQNNVSVCKEKIIFDLNDKQRETIIELIQTIQDLGKIAVLSLILNISNRDDISYRDLAKALNVPVCKAKEIFLLALKEIKQTIESEYGEDDYLQEKEKQ